MRFLFILLLVAGILFAQAQSGQSTIVAALTALCATSKSLFSLSGAFCCVGGLIPLLIGAVLYYFKKENKTLKLTGVVLLGIGAITLAVAAFLFLVYLLTPYLIKALVGSEITVVC